MSEPKSRELTKAEAGCVNLIKVFEEACNNRKLVVTVSGPKAAADAVHSLEMKHKLIKTLRVDYSSKDERYRVTFALSEFKKYTDIMLSQCGMTLLHDGSILTYDKLVFPNTYLEGL